MRFKFIYMALSLLLLLPAVVQGSVCAAFLARNPSSQALLEMTELGHSGYVRIGLLSSEERQALRDQLSLLPAGFTFGYSGVYLSVASDKPGISPRGVLASERETVARVFNEWGKPLEAEFDRVLAPIVDVALVGVDIRDYNVTEGITPTQAAARWHEDDGGFRIMIPVEGIGLEHRDKDHENAASEFVAEGEVFLFAGSSWSERFATRPFWHRTPQLSQEEFRKRKLVVFDFYLYPKDLRNGERPMDFFSLSPEDRARVMAIVLRRS